MKVGKPRIYIAGPYTKGDVAVNVRRAIEEADWLLSLGCTPYLPHLTHFWHLICPRAYEDWMALDLEWLGVCHAIYRLSGESTGADSEVDSAGRMGMPVLRSRDEVTEWLAGWKAGGDQ